MLRNVLTRMRRRSRRSEWCFLYINGQLAKFVTSTKSLDTMGDHYQLNDNFNESSTQGLVAHFRRFLDGCSIRVGPMCTIMYDSGCGFLQWHALIGCATYYHSSWWCINHNSAWLCKVMILLTILVMFPVINRSSSYRP